MSDSEVQSVRPGLAQCLAVGNDEGLPPSARSHGSRASASKRGHSSSDSGSSSSDSSVTEVKRRRRGGSDFDYHDLIKKVGMLTNILLYNAGLPPQQVSESVSIPVSHNTMHTATPVAPGSAPEPTPGPTSCATATTDFCLQRPAVPVAPCTAEPRLLSLGHVGTALKEPKVPRADPDHLMRLELLQKFGDPAWKDVRYTDALKIHNASPGFVDLEVNDELRQFVKGKDYFASSEKIVAAICNGLISQRELLNQNLQQFVNWTASAGTVLSADNIFDKINELFQPTSKFHKTGDEIMQMVCGKRAEYIENRRERILSELPNKNLREGLRKIPPSSRHLFDENQLCIFIRNTGGLDKWVRPWYAEKEGHKRMTKPVKAGPSQNNAAQSFRPQSHDTKRSKPFQGSSKPSDQKKPKKEFRKETQHNKKQFNK